MSPVTDRALDSTCATRPDVRKPRGTLDPRPARPTRTAAAILCGGKTRTAVAQRGRDDHHRLGLLGFTRRAGQRYRSPGVGELSTVAAARDADAFAAAPRRWLPADEPAARVAIDGKRRRGWRDGAVAGVHRVSADDGDAKAVPARVPVGDTHEAQAARILPGLIPLAGVVVTGDAAFTRRPFGQAVVAGGGDSVLPVQDHQPASKAAIATGLGRAFSPAGASRTSGGG